MQTDNILILANNDFASTKQNAIKLAKIKIKSKENLTFAYSIKFKSV